ncbi:hypothetical protein [Pseudarthrobacter sp. N5]|uniref:hypothetical protein n=1 Tax=Pseudarthrobacter sp. N5 TaxID=3418416 RepID=UPI003CEF172D
MLQRSIEAADVIIPNAAREDHDRVTVQGCQIEDPPLETTLGFLHSPLTDSRSPVYRSFL